MRARDAAVHKLVNSLGKHANLGKILCDGVPSFPQRKGLTARNPRPSMACFFDSCRRSAYSGLWRSIRQCAVLRTPANHFTFGVANQPMAQVAESQISPIRSRDRRK